MTATLRPRHARRLAALPALALTAAAAGVACLFAPAPAAAAAPEPAPIPRRWQLEIEPSPLHTIVVDTPGYGPRGYFFLTYKVTNNSTMDLLFAPSFELATDDMNVYRSGRDVPVSVTNTIKERLANPLVEDQISIVGNLLRGEENAKEGLVVWPIPDMHGSELAIYCAGFSGETATVEIPVVPDAQCAEAPMANTDAKPGAHANTDERPSRVAHVSNAAAGVKAGDGATSETKTEKKILRKTLELRYRLPGDLNPASDPPLRPFSSRWIMR